MFWVNPYSQRNQRARLWPVRGPAIEAETRAAQAQAREAAEAERNAFEQKLWAIRRDLAALKAELAARRAAWERADEAARIKRDVAWERFVQTYKRYAEQQKAGFDPNQPRDELGRWTNGGGTAAGGQQSLHQDRGPELRATAREQAARPDLPQLESIANDPLIRSRIDQAWAASNPNGTTLREQGFWISRNEATGELSTRPFANPGSAGSITPGSPPNDAIASFHTHPLRPDFGGRPGPSRGDLSLAESIGLPGILQSHVGMYYFGPQLRSQTSR